MSKEQVKAVLHRVLTWLSELESQDESAYRLTDEQVGGGVPTQTHAG
jgi:hypothetical protein